MTEGAEDQSSLPLLLRIPVKLLKLLWDLAVIAVPLMGVWVGSSLAAYANGPVWLVCLCGLLAFPILPLLWELRAHRKRKAAIAAGEREATPRILTFFDRMILRTLFLNVIFLVGIWFTVPQLGFTAISARGDWMLDNREEPWAQTARQGLFQVADSLEWIYLATSDNPYRRYDDDSADKYTPKPNKTFDKPKPKPDKVAKKPDTTTKKPDATTKPDAPVRKGAITWPLPATLHPLVTSIPASQETDYKSVARYLVSKESDPFQRVKALHDYVADRIAYDAAALARGEYPPQDAETVFRTKLGVCAGYSKLFVAMAEEVGIKAAYVVGHSRDNQGVSDLGGAGHAWNAVEIQGNWYLMDITWDSGSVRGATFTKRYSTNYFLTPPDIFVLNHIPDKDIWQLLEKPLTRGEFMRQPILSPGFFANGLKLVSPTRSQIEARGRAQFRIGNPAGRFMLANAVLKGSTTAKRCKVQNGPTIVIDCDLPRSGVYAVDIFVGPKQYNSRYVGVGRFEVTNSP